MAWVAEDVVVRAVWWCAGPPLVKTMFAANASPQLLDMERVWESTLQIYDVYCYPLVVLAVRHRESWRQAEETLTYERATHTGNVSNLL